MRVSRNNEVHLCNHCCSRREINVAYSEGVLVALGNQHPMCMRRTVICDLSTLSVTCPHYLINGTILKEGKKISLKIKGLFIFFTTFV